MKTKEERQKIKIEKEQKRDFEKYGIKAGEINYTKEKSVKKSYKPLFNCLKYAKDYKWHLALILLVALVMALISIGFPIATQGMVDNIYNSDINAAILFLVIFFGLGVVFTLLNIVWDLASDFVSIKVSQKLQQRLISDLFKTQINIFDTTNSGAILSRVNSDTNTITDSIFNIINRTYSIVRALGCLIVFFVINIWFALLLIASMIVYYLIDKIYQNIFYKYRKKVSYLGDKAVGITNEIVRGVRDAKLLNVSETVKKTHSLIIGNKYKAMWDSSIKSKPIYTLRDLIFYVCRFLCLGFAFVLFLNGQISIGSVVICIFYSGNCLDLITNFSKIKEQVKISLVSAERINEIMTDTYPKEKFGNKELENIQGKIELKNVEFSYNNDKPLFKNLNLVINPNQCIGFVGKSGEGKSTIISLISKLYELQDGQILIDDTDITSLTENSLRSTICVVSQNPYIFNMSIKENMLIAKEDATDDEIQDACKKAYLSEFIESLPEKYNTQVGEGGVQLSGGQKQRLAIARALLHDSKIILLDEATSALDNESQEYIKKTIRLMQKTKTIIIVAHRLSTVIDCDKIFVVSNNKIIASGKHKTLLQNCDIYKQLYNNEEEDNNKS